MTLSFGPFLPHPHIAHVPEEGMYFEMIIPLPIFLLFPRNIGTAPAVRRRLSMLLIKSAIGLYGPGKVGGKHMTQLLLILKSQLM